MHDIEKWAIVKTMMASCWNEYCKAPALIPYQSRFPQFPKWDANAEPTGKAGFCYWREYRGINIWINTAYYHGPENDSSLRQTIAHELAHYLDIALFPDRKQWHGPSFRMIMQSIGYNGETYHRMSVAKAKSVAKQAKKELFDL